eukprot:1113759-Amphidinium_carterae.1
MPPHRPRKRFRPPIPFRAKGKQLVSRASVYGKIVKYKHDCSTTCGHFVAQVRQDAKVPKHERD